MSIIHTRHKLPSSAYFSLIFDLLRRLDSYIYDVDNAGAGNYLKLLHIFMIYINVIYIICNAAVASKAVSLLRARKEPHRDELMNTMISITMQTEPRRH